MKILVTGATSFIGIHIVEELAKQGLSIRAAHRPGENFQKLQSDFLIEGLDLESVALNLTDEAAVKSALEGCQLVFHADHLCSWRKKDKKALYEINHRSTQVLAKVLEASGVEKLIYTSGMETLRPPPKTEKANEENGVALEDLKTDFERSRFLAEREVLHLKQKGFPIILVHPTVCLGTREQQHTFFGKFLARFLQKKCHFYLDTGLNLVDVVDVAKGHLLAAKRGKIGARYLLGNQNVFMIEILKKLSKISLIPPPKTVVPLGFAKLGNFFAQKLLRRDGFPNAFLEVLQKPLFYDCRLAHEELAMPQSDVWKALERMVSDVKKHHA